MSVATAEPTLAPKNSAPNKNESAWKAEIHRPEAEYNANVPLDTIERDPSNRLPAEADIAARAESIKSVGLLQPVVLRALGGGRYQLMAGETRWRAFKLLKRATIPARIYKDQSEVDAATKALVENAQRADLTPIERAKRFKQLEELKLSQKEIGRLAGGVSQPVVANAIRLLELPEEVQKLVAAGELSEAHGVALVKWAKWPRVCECIARMADTHGYTAKDLVREGMPFAGQLVQERLIEEINTGLHYSGPMYKLPRQFGSHRDFIVGQYKTHYVLPKEPKDNVWAPEKARQDEERNKAESDAAKREAKRNAAAGGQTAEQRERKATLERNKKKREDLQKRLVFALGDLAKLKVPTSRELAVLASEAIAGGYYPKRILEVAEMLELKVPRGVVSSTGGNGLRCDDLAKMKPADIAKLAVGVILHKQADDACRNPQGFTPLHLNRYTKSVAGATAATPPEIERKEMSPQLDMSFAAGILAKTASRKGGAK